MVNPELHRKYCLLDELKYMVPDAWPDSPVVHLSSPWKVYRQDEFGNAVNATMRASDDANKCTEPLLMRKFNASRLAHGMLDTNAAMPSVAQAMYLADSAALY